MIERDMQLYNKLNQLAVRDSLTCIDIHNQPPQNQIVGHGPQNNDDVSFFESYDSGNYQTTTRASNRSKTPNVPNRVVNYQQFIQSRQHDMKLAGKTVRMDQRPQISFMGKREQQ